MKSLLMTATIASGVLSQSLTAQLVFSTAVQTTTIDFQSNVGFSGNPDTSVGDNVFKSSTGNFRALLERSNSGWVSSWDTGTWGFSADAWSWYASGQDLGRGIDNPTLFEDYNGDSDLVDRLDVMPGVDPLDRAALGIGAAGDRVFDMGNATNGAFRDYSLTLRVVNNSGAPINSWSAAIDTWHVSSDDNVSVISLEWSTDNSIFTSIDSYTGANTAGTLTAAADPLTGAFSAVVPDGGYLYIKLAAMRVNPNNTSGSAIVFDNWTVAAVPEPSTYALLSGLLAFGAILWRRVRSAR